MLGEENTRKTPKEKHHRTGGNKQIKELSRKGILQGESLVQMMNKVK
jgi:hypothetical protein